MLTPPPRPWIATTGPLTVSVSPSTLEYSVSVGTNTWLANGSVAVQCAGRRYCSLDGNLTGGGITAFNGSDPTLGPYAAIQRTWTAATCTAITTAVRNYQRGGIEFVTSISAAGADGTSTEPTLRTSGTTPAT